MNLPLQMIFFSALTASIVAQTPPQTAESALETGNQLIEAGKYCEALKVYKTGLALNPTGDELLYNSGLAALQCRDFVAALDSLGRLKKLAPDDWQLRAKLVQTYQALGKTAERDAERAELFDMRKGGSNQELSGQTEYCRDRFDAAGERVMAFEHFELTGERAVRYTFDVMSATGKEPKYHISLGSYDMTNKVWHETTKPPPPPDARLFHLDGYWENGHITYAMFPSEPSYDEVRALVVKILSKELKPISGTSASPPNPKK
jgi:tetratricopeptide (TPR) repeat protein